MSRVLLIGDVHLRDAPPVNNTPEFLDDLWHSLDVIEEMSEDFDATVFAGDLFDFKQPSKTSHALMQRAIQTFGSMHNAWCIAGNHDLSADRMESLLVKQPLGVLVRSGAIKLLNGWMSEHYSEAPNLPVYGISWQQEWEKSLPWVMEPYRDATEHPGSVALIVTHAPLFPTGDEPPYEFIDLNEFAAAMGNTGNVFYGHIHDSHGIFTDPDGTVKFANHGSLNRARLTKSDIERQVTVTAWDSETGEFTAIPIPDQLPAKRIFRLDAATASKAEQRTLDDFLTAVGHSTIDISTTSSITEHIRSLPAPQPVQDRAIALIEEADS